MLSSLLQFCNHFRHILTLHLTEEHNWDSTTFTYGCLGKSPENKVGWVTAIQNCSLKAIFTLSFTYGSHFFTHEQELYMVVCIVCAITFLLSGSIP
jgi:hypothetical protein